MTDARADGEAEALELLGEAGTAIVLGIERCLAGWVVVQVERILDAWGRAGPEERAAAVRAARIRGPEAAARVAAELRVLFAADPSVQVSTPLQVVRTAVREPTEILATAGIPAVERDPFDERAHPEDRYDLSPRTLGDLGDPDLAPLLLAWGVAKSRVLRLRSSPPTSPGFVG